MRRHPDNELIRRLREVGAGLGEHVHALNEIRGETLIPAPLHLERVVRRVGSEPRFSPELRAALDEMGRDREPARTARAE